VSEGIDVDKVKRELVEAFSKEVNGCKSVEDLVYLLYRYPGCGHSCGISYVIMDVLEKNGIDEDVYWDVTTPEEMKARARAAQYWLHLVNEDASLMLASLLRKLAEKEGRRL
jgi:hypothetical protein